MQSVENKIIKIIQSHGKSWAFSEKDFSQLGTREAIDTALHRLKKKGTIRNVLRGVYDYPKTGTLIAGLLGPDIDQVAHAIARKHGWTIEPSGETALNILGLSTQVPGRYLFYSDGPNRKYMVVSLPLEFRRRALKDIRMKLPKSVLLVQALKALGKERITPEIIVQLRPTIKPEECRKILKDTQYVTEWIHRTIQKICTEE